MGEDSSRTSTSPKRNLLLLPTSSDLCWPNFSWTSLLLSEAQLKLTKWILELELNSAEMCLTSPLPKNHSTANARQFTTFTPCPRPQLWSLSRNGKKKREKLNLNLPFKERLSARVKNILKLSKHETLTIACSVLQPNISLAVMPALILQNPTLET